MDEESLFAAVAGQPPGPGRDAYLDEACGGDAAMRDRIARLLAAHDRSRGILDASAPPAAHPGRAGAVIAGRYELVKAVGEGGMGAVWLAEQVEPVRRRVALKLIRPGMDSRAVLARFEAERQALALMDHPHIARVFDGGTADDGRPFFVMEYVEGVPITQYCDDARLGIAERLELFLPVCQAVQHAHTKGIIHRDLKPGNILVALQDGRPVHKVIDFGLAKAIGPNPGGDTMHTAPGVLLGTPLYMSPEQAGAVAFDVDARADIYSLGVILYELLTGTTPLDRQRFRDAAWDEILRLIRQEDPPPPSSRLGGSDSLPSLAALRRLEPARLARRVRGDLDWIVMKCLEKERSRRYETPSALARDIRLHLDDESVEARPPTARYRLGKFLRRNRGLAIAASTIFVLLVGGIVGTTWGLVRANRAREREADRYRQVLAGVEILASVFDDLDPREEERDAKPLRAVLGDRLARAAAQVEGEAVGDPLVVARLQDRLGMALVHLGLGADAVPLIGKARATRAARLGGDHPDTLEAMNNLAQAYSAAGKPAQSLPLLEQAYAAQKARLGPTHASTLDTMNSLGTAYQEVGDLDRALPLLKEALRLHSATLGPNHGDTLVLRSNLAGLHLERGEPGEAVKLLGDSIAGLEATLGPDHPDTIGALNNLAAAAKATGDVDRAITIYQRFLAGLRKTLGPSHPSTLAGQNNLAAAYRAAGKVEESLTLLRETAEAAAAQRFAISPAAAIVANLIGTLELLKQYPEAETWRKRWMAFLVESGGADSLPWAEQARGLGSNLLRQERWADAEASLRQSLAIRQSREPSAWTTAETRSMLGRALIEQGKYAEAEPLLVQAYEALRAGVDRIPEPNRDVIGVAGQRLVRLYEQWGRPADADAWKQRLAREAPPAPKP